MLINRGWVTVMNTDAGGVGRSILWAAIIIAIGIFLSAQRIAYVVSYEGKWDSCMKTFTENRSSPVLKLDPDARDRAAVTACMNSMMGRPPAIQ